MPLPQIAPVVVFNVVIFDPELDLIREVQSFTSLPDAMACLYDIRNLEMPDELDISMEIHRDDASGEISQILLLNEKTCLAAVRRITVGPFEEEIPKALRSICKKLAKADKDGAFRDEALEIALIELYS